MRSIFFLLLTFLLAITACKKNDVDNSNGVVSVKGFWPNSGNPGTIVTITGTGLNQVGESDVLFNGTPAQIMDQRDSVIKVLAPAGASSGEVTVTVDGQKFDVGQYTFQVLSLYSINPANGPAGTNVAIRGMGFSSVSGPAKVFINGKEAIITSINDTFVVAAIPVDAGTGAVKVVVDGKEVTGPGFLFQNIKSLKPLRGGKGTKVTISGEGFSSIPSENTVLFNGKTASVLSADANSLVVEAPDGVTSGPVSITINGQQTVGSAFSVVPPPVIEAVAPLSGPAGTDVIIKGENFTNFTDEVVITFNGVPATVTSAAEKTIVVKVPANAGTGTMNITVNDQHAMVPEFKEQNLGIAQITPDNGLDGDVVTIKGFGFSANAAENRVSFNGTSATITHASSTELTVTVPSGVSSGALNITVGALSANGPAFSRSGVMTLAGGPGNTDFQGMNGIAVDSKGNVFVATTNNIKKVTPSGQVSLFAGSTQAGLTDGDGSAARFNYISGLAIDNNDDLYVSDQFNNSIRKVTSQGLVSTVGTPPGSPVSIAADPQGNIYVGQSYNGAFLFNKNTGVFTKVLNSMYETGTFIAPVSPTHIFYAADWDYYAVFRVFNGLKSFHINTSNSYGFADGTYASALFNNFSGLAVSKDGATIYILNNGTLRRATDNTVTTLIGQGFDGFPPGGFINGSFNKARFSSPKNMCLDKDGNLYVADVGNRAIRKVFFR